MGKRTALVLGASGLVGSEVTKLLVNNENYSAITIFVREKLDITDPKVTQIQIDFEQLENYIEYFEVNDVFSCLGTTIKKAKSKENFVKVDFDYPVVAARLANEMQVQNYLLISAIGASTNTNNFYLQTKGKVEEEVKRVFSNHIHIFRPSLLTGERDEFRFGEKLGEWALKACSFLLVGRLKKYKPVAGKTVAAAMLAAAQQEFAHHINVYESDQISEKMP